MILYVSVLTRLLGYAFDVFDVLTCYGWCM